VGGGPAGLSCAYHLARRGIKSVIYEAATQGGRRLGRGVPSTDFPAKACKRKWIYIADHGCGDQAQHPHRKDVSFEHLQKDYDAVFLAVGAPESFELNVPGEDDAENVIPALEYLKKPASAKTCPRAIT
jgi:NADPH-dependent glutamate synthase beta subunit-like oxidoreductase